jgi:L-asparaginase / beta-aspartyl-peptidase
MLRTILCLILFTTTNVASALSLVVHGGAGVIRRDEMKSADEKAIRAALTRATSAGYATLKNGGSSLDAVTTVVTILEDSPYFNAGKGAVFNADGHNELDAAIMDGATLRAGAVAGVHKIKNPVLLARAVMEKSTHVLLVGDGAENFARTVGFAFVDQNYFYTKKRWLDLRKAKQLERTPAGQSAPHHYGTVGAIALDQLGHLAAATSTGGLTNKRYGRVGDSPLIGAGTYADSTCAVSATGTGEYFIRAVAAHSVCDRVRLAGETIAVAAKHVIVQDIGLRGGDGGLIAMDAQGRISTPFNTEGMYRAYVDAQGIVHVAIYGEDEHCCDN